MALSDAAGTNELEAADEAAVLKARLSALRNHYRICVESVCQSAAMAAKAVCINANEQQKRAAAAMAEAADARMTKDAALAELRDLRTKLADHHANIIEATSVKAKESAEIAEANAGAGEVRTTAPVEM